MMIIDYSSADWPQLEDLWVKSWQAAMPQIDFEARRGWFNAHVGELHTRGYLVLCAADGTRIVGFVIFDPVSGHLDQLAVAPDAARKGCGRALMRQVRLRTDEPITLDVNEDNAGAVAFYKAEGFGIVGEGVNERSGLKTFQMELKR